MPQIMMTKVHNISFFKEKQKQYSPWEVKKFSLDYFVESHKPRMPVGQQTIDWLHILTASQHKHKWDNQWR